MILIFPQETIVTVSPYLSEQWRFKVIVQQALVEIVHVGQQKAQYERYQISQKVSRHTLKLSLKE